MAKTASASAVFFLPVVIIIFGAFPRPISTQSKPNQQSDLVHYGDLIDIDVVGSLEYDWRGGLNPEGFLDGFSPDNATVYGLCRSESDLAADVEKLYSRILKAPKVVVKILDRSGRAVTLLVGAVRNQQRFKLSREVRLNELLAVSGGITDTASGEVTVFRPPDLNCFKKPDTKEKKNSSVMRFKLSQILQGDPESNPVILSGDIVTVVEASPIYVIGGVNAPKPISSRDEVSVTRAIAAAGGLSKEANENDITVYRRDSKGSKTIAVDLKKINAKQQDDILLKPFDIVEVSQKGRPKSKYPPALSSEQISRDIYKMPVRIIE